MDNMNGMGHSGHDMSSMTMSGGIFTAADQHYAYSFWYAVAVCVGLLTTVRAINVLQARNRLRASKTDPHCIPSRPKHWLTQIWATATATTREALYPQPIYFTGKLSRYFSPLPIGKWLVLILYWIIVLSLLWKDTILKPDDPMYPYKWEKIGFRAAWVTVTQLPFVFLLSCKFNPISLLTGISYERFNWLHRWAARTMWLTAIVHWSFFYTEWSIAEIVTLEIKMMPMVKYGFGAWGVVTWMLLSGFGFFRDLSYEFFVLQHIAAAGTLLWLLYVHVPSYATYNIWICVAVVAFDWGVRTIWAMLRNLHILGGGWFAAPGYTTHLEVLPGDVVRLTIYDADFKWRAGQHAYVMMPGLRPFELHPFTIANAARDGQDQDSQRLTMVVRAQSGFSKTLHRAAQRSSTHWRYRTILTGPWGTPPDLTHYDTIVFIACSTGASFIVPVLQDVVRRQNCIRKAALHWIIRHEGHCAWFERDLKEVVKRVQEQRLILQIEVHQTKSGVSEDTVNAGLTNGTTTMSSIDSSASDSSSTSSMTSVEDDKSPLQHGVRRMPPSLQIRRGSRPTLDSMIRPEVETALGETAVVVCGGLSITAEARTYVAALSDERGVHKGTGGQGIYLFTETYGW